MATVTAAVERDVLSFYVDVEAGEFADLEVVSTAAIAWSQAVRAAAQSMFPDDDIRITLIAAERGSSNWLAKIERSSANQTLERVKRGWKALPLIVRVGIGLGVVIPTTAVPTAEYWLDNEGFSAKQKKEMAEIVGQVAGNPAVEAPKRQMYRSLQRDRKITGLGSGVPTKQGWKPERLVPANQFAEADGLFMPQLDLPQEKVITSTLDVILVSPTLENAERVWVFRQEGIPGTFRAIMKDHRFLAALERQGIKEQVRSRIPMRIRIEVRQRMTEGEWKVVRKGRSVVEVISPQVD